MSFAVNRISDSEKHALLQRFLNEWPIERVENLTLENYVIGAANFKETFCYWVETVTSPLGNIKGVSGGGSFKFGIFYKNLERRYDTHGYTDDGTYAWKRQFGNDRNEAFSQILNRVLRVIKCSLNDDFEGIEAVDLLFPLFKWKVAFLYSDYKLFPVYKKEWLIKIATELGYSGDSMQIVDLQLFIISKRPAGADFWKWCRELLKKYIHTTEYYLIGSKYQDDNKKFNSILPELLKRSVVSVGFHYHSSLEKVFNKDINKIEAYLQKNVPDKSARTALRNFLQIKEGTILAVKDYSQKGQTKITAYAVVKPGPDGEIYRFDEAKDSLGHLLHVEFIEKDVDLTVPLVKPHTLHHISEPEEIELIFGAYQRVESQEEDETDDEFPAKGKRKGTDKKSTKGHKRKGTKDGWMNEFHNNLQQAFFEALKEQKKNPDSITNMEEDFIDVKYEDNAIIEIYEVKTASTASKCIREALGQLTYYSSKLDSDKQLKTYVVGPRELLENDVRFLQFVKNNFQIELDYIHFPLPAQ